MDQLKKTLLSAFMGTNFMTAYSALHSYFAGENFREPDHLQTMVKRLVPALDKKWLTIAGWGAHYAMGVVFAGIYVELWEAGKIKANLKTALVIGGISGIAGALIWKGTFKAHPLPPWINYNKYYLQRIPAHVVFAIFATLNYQLIRDSKRKKAALLKTIV
ncbi:hypothetical protein DYU05_09660 [Mucilaginibacter terrenus]|uniref:DUF2938 domain-containing protein n=1 Tax=Mucilaginibacter terrenus TaxID=2482727 RepID=A0A3E2NXT5_9SPHI|nr:hypothetical protein [Mucilaginibacter terrenus]RFZ85836.1 hypothetical protein DYU05_09660 [Mucilaginibacter terrenus]